MAQNNEDAKCYYLKIPKKDRAFGIAPWVMRDAEINLTQEGLVFRKKNLGDY